MKLRGPLALALMLVCAPGLAQVNPGTSPLSIAKGGTAGATASAARTNLGLANLFAVSLISHQWIDSVVSGVPHQSQPAIGDLQPIAAGTFVMNFSGSSAAPVATSQPTVSNSSAPSTPASGFSTWWSDSTDLRLHDKNSAGTIGTTVVSSTASSHQFATGVSSAGVVAYTQPVIGDLGAISAGTFVMNFAGTSAAPVATSQPTVANSVAPSTPAAGFTTWWGDSTDLRLHDKNSAGTIGTTVVANSCGANQFASSISAAGVVTCIPIASSSVTNAMHANMAAWTIKGNPSSSAAAPSDFTIDSGLTLKASPVAGDEIMIWDVAGSALKKVTIGTVASVGSGRPYAIVNRTTDQSFTSGSTVVLSLNSVSVDTGTYWDAITNFRYTPLVSGYYRVNWNVEVNATYTVGQAVISYLYKNAAVFTEGSFMNAATAGAGTLNSVGSSMVQMNGSTDFFDIRIFSNGTTPKALCSTGAPACGVYISYVGP